MNGHLFRTWLKMRLAARRLLGRRSWNSDVDQRDLIKNPKVIFDIGANVGQTALRYRALFPMARIFSFEPEPQAFGALKETCAGDPFTEAVQAAVSDECAVQSLNILKHSLANSLMKPEGGWSDIRNTIQVSTTTVDTFCRERGIEIVDILKVDVEGGESAVFRGAQEMFERRAIRNVFTEVYFDRVYSGMALFADLDGYLKVQGFRLHGLYSLSPAHEGHLMFANALYRLGS